VYCVRCWGPGSGIPDLGYFWIRRLDRRLDTCAFSAHFVISFKSEKTNLVEQFGFHRSFLFIFFEVLINSFIFIFGLLLHYGRSTHIRNSLEQTSIKLSRILSIFISSKGYHRSNIVILLLLLNRQQSELLRAFESGIRTE
jgi:hypothetical protein